MPMALEDLFARPFSLDNAVQHTFILPPKYVARANCNNPCKLGTLCNFFKFFFSTRGRRPSECSPEPFPPVFAKLNKIWNNLWSSKDTCNIFSCRSAANLGQTAQPQQTAKPSPLQRCHKPHRKKCGQRGIRPFASCAPKTALTHPGTLHNGGAREVWSHHRCGNAANRTKKRLLHGPLCKPTCHSIAHATLIVRYFRFRAATPGHACPPSWRAIVMIQ